MNDPLRDYFDGLRSAPVPVRLLTETPPEAFLRRLGVNLCWAAAAVALVVAVTSVPSPTDSNAAVVAARAMNARVALRSEVLR